MTQVRRLFKDVYLESNNWMDVLDVKQVDEYLKSAYSRYFNIDGMPNYALLKQEIINNNTTHAKDLFKTLFKMPVQLDSAQSLSDCEPLKEVKNIAGHLIVAHGIEEAKGGMYNILLMCVTNAVRVKSIHWGYFKDGPPNMSPVPHGPYYIVYSTNIQKNKSSKWPNNPKLEDVEFILVPFQENIEILHSHLRKLVEHDMLSQNQMDKFASKLIDYQAFENLVKTQLKEKANHKPSSKSDQSRSKRERKLSADLKLFAGNKSPNPVVRSRTVVNMTKKRKLF